MSERSSALRWSSLVVVVIVAVVERHAGGGGAGNLSLEETVLFVVFLVFLGLVTDMVTRVGAGGLDWGKPKQASQQSVLRAEQGSSAALQQREEVNYIIKRLLGSRGDDDALRRPEKNGNAKNYV